MKTKILFLLCVFFISTSLKAQNDPVKDITKMMGSKSGMGSLMGTLVNGIKPNAFTSGKSAKKDLISQLAGTKTTDYLQYASLAGQLAGALKGSSFLPDWANKKDGVMDQLQKAGSIADVAGGVGSLAGMLNPSSLTGGFKKNQSTWTTALNALSLLK
ncbi:MAG: hypothetical protein ABI840_10590 [bacterium]